MLAPLEREDKNDVSICIMQAYLKALKFRSYIHNLCKLVIETVLIKQLAMVQFNLNLTEHVCSIGLTQHVFHFTSMQACMHVHTKLIMSNLLCKSIVYALDMCTTVCRCTRTCQKCKRQIWITCACKL